MPQTYLYFTINHNNDFITRWFKYDRDYLCVNKSQFVPVIFEPPCTLKSLNVSALFTAQHQAIQIHNLKHKYMHKIRIMCKLCICAAWYWSVDRAEGCKTFKNNKLVFNTRWYKYDRDKLWLVYTQIVPVIFEPPCMFCTVHCSIITNEN
jgi:hypothetical protein